MGDHLPMIWAFLVVAAVAVGDGRFCFFLK